MRTFFEDRVFNSMHFVTLQSQDPVEQTRTEYIDPPFTFCYPHSDGRDRKVMMSVPAFTFRICVYLDLTKADTDDMGGFVTCKSMDWRSGAVLTYKRFQSTVSNANLRLECAILCYISL